MIKLHADHGIVILKLDEERAPGTTANFKGYVKSDHCNNTAFHHTINNFIIQDGGFEPGTR